MQWLLQYEENAASRLSLIYRLVHDTEAPIPNYVSRSTIYSVPARQGEVQTIPYFTDARLFGPRFSEMRAAMAKSVGAFRKETGANLADLPGDLGLTAQFLGQVTPAQAILSGTSSFRLDRLAVYLSANGPQVYFKEGLMVAYSKHEARRFADELLEEVLGSCRAPNVEYRNHEQYLTAAFRIAENRARADEIYLSLLQQIARFWGTLLAVRGYSQGESFVARNVGLKSFWDQGQWKVKIIFMDHDALAIPGRRERKFYAYSALPNMALDERHIWGKSSPELFAMCEVGCLQKIYRIGSDLQVKGQAVAQAALKNAYQKTQHRLLTDPRARKSFNQEFIERLPDWDTLVRGYFRMNGNTSATTWKKQMRKKLPPKKYKLSQLDSFLDVIEKNRGFLERNSFLFDNAVETVPKGK
jgi:hypothetical protein